MSGTPIGGRKAAKTNRKKHGRDFYKKIGAKGGSSKGHSKGSKKPRGFASKDHPWRNNHAENE